METKAERAKKREEWRAKEAVEIEAAKYAVARDHGLERNAKFDKAWDIAWSHGHASGLNEVVMYFDELAELIK